MKTKFKTNLRYLGPLLLEHSVCFDSLMWLIICHINEDVGQKSAFFVEKLVFSSLWLLFVPLLPVTFQSDPLSQNDDSDG